MVETKAVFTQAVSAGVFAERCDMDRNNPAEIAAAKDRKNPIEIVTLSEKTLFFSRKLCLFSSLLSHHFRQLSRPSTISKTK